MALQHRIPAGAFARSTAAVGVAGAGPRVGFWQIVQTLTTTGTTTLFSGGERCAQRRLFSNGPERPTLRRILRAARLMVEDKACAAGRTVHQKFVKRVFRRTPLHAISWTLYLVLLVPGFYFFIYKNYLVVEEHVSVYPRPIADELRSALYYGTYAPTPHQNHERTLQHYRRALELCAEHGLDPLSDEVLGIKVRIVEWLMNGAARHDSAVATLESTLGECLRGVVEMDCLLGRGGDGEGLARELNEGLGGDVTAARIEAELTINKSVDKDMEEKSVEKVVKKGVEKSAQETVQEPIQKATEENPWHRRRRLLHKAIQICLSLGWMFSDEHVLQPYKAQVTVSWAFEATMKELLRRRAEGVREGEGEWMTLDEIGALLEQLAHQHEEKSRFHLSIPLFFHAQRLCRDPCHRAVLMNNLAASFAQHPAHAPFQLLPEAFASVTAGGAGAGTPVEVPTTRAEFLETAQRWATNALTQARSVPRTETVNGIPVAAAGGSIGQAPTNKNEPANPGECDGACAAALCTLGDVLVLMGRPEEALKRFAAARGVGVRTGQRGVAQMARERIKELEGKK